MQSTKDSAKLRPSCFKNSQNVPSESHRTRELLIEESFGYITYMKSTSLEILGWRKHKLESRLPGEI